MRTWFLAIASLATLWATAQPHLGFHSDNYAGIYNLYFQPADIVDSRYVFDMNLAGVDMMASNNYVGIRRQALFQDRATAFDDPDFQDNYLVERLNGRDKGIINRFEAMGPLSFMFNFREKNALAFGWRTRTYFNAVGIDEDLARQAYNELDLVDLYNVGISNQDFALQGAAWYEAGFTYGREVLDLDEHYLKAAGGLRLTVGFASTYLYSDNLQVSFPNDSMVSIEDTDLRFGFADNFTSGSDGVSFDFLPGMAGDVGVVYEWRPDIEDHRYTMDGDSTWLDPRRNKYKLKVGFSVTDIGNARFRRSEVNGTPISNSFFADAPNVRLQHFLDGLEEFGDEGLQPFYDTLASKYTITGADGDIYRMRLPMRLNLTVDYNIWKGFYVNGTATIAPRFRNAEVKSSALTSFSITPRFEHKWFGAFFPFSADALGNLHFGTGLRLGPLIIGTRDITPLLGRKVIYGADAYAMLRIPIGKKLRDRDEDHVSNKMDLCKKEPGPWATRGCPDLDGDGITNDVDRCPDVPGLAEFDGCPDSDGDGITDGSDDCPELAGTEELNGCPDTDEDGIIDPNDSCVYTAGIPAFNGCPDTDADGIMDREDDCPEVRGLPAFAGCPDTDADGLRDIDDRCPEKAGPAENDGCPYNDDDNDGVRNDEDECPRTPGPASNRGCPEISEEEQEVIDVAFENLEFETGKAVIRPRSYESLQGLADLMLSRDDLRLRIAGHTDDVGSEENNLALSRERATAVKDYLVQYDIDGSRFIVEAYGEARPIADNDTEDGRALNRRVELEIVFE